MYLWFVFQYRCIDFSMVPSRFEMRCCESRLIEVDAVLTCFKVFCIPFPVNGRAIRSLAWGAGRISVRRHAHAVDLASCAVGPERDRREEHASDRGDRLAAWPVRGRLERGTGPVRA
jgi:hypothetical protein